MSDGVKCYGKKLIQSRGMWYGGKEAVFFI